MFTQLEKLLENSDQLSLSVKKVNGKLVVSTTATISNPNTEFACKVRQSLSAPFVVSATASELDDGYASALESHIGTFNHNALRLPSETTPVALPESPDTESDELSEIDVTETPEPVNDEFADIEEL